MRVVIADDSVLVREGIASLLTRSGIEVIAQASSPDELLALVDADEPDAAVIDIRMPPTHTDEGLKAAHAIRERHPDVAIMILSQYVEAGIATRLLAEVPERLGYLLKDRVDRAGGVRRRPRACGRGRFGARPADRLGPAGGRRTQGGLERLTAREREVLELVAEGMTNQAIATRLDIALRSVEKHVSTIFTKLGLPDTGSEHRRVLAVLRFLRP